TRGRTGTDTGRAGNWAARRRPIRPLARVGPCDRKSGWKVAILMTDLQQATAPLAGAVAGRRAPARPVTVLLTAVAYFMVALDALVVVTALPSVHRDLGGSIGTLQWTVNVYSLAFGAG